jgi:hypothetical protein
MAVDVNWPKDDKLIKSLKQNNQVCLLQAAAVSVDESGCQVRGVESYKNKNKKG